MNFELSIFNWLRKKGGRNFRKSLGVYHYKIGHLEYHKKPGVIPLHIKEKLKKVSYKKMVYIHILHNILGQINEGQKQN